LSAEAERDPLEQQRRTRNAGTSGAALMMVALPRTRPASDEAARAPGGGGDPLGILHGPRRGQHGADHAVGLVEPLQVD
jgi:hypothetical protein